jgi:hypothetical protein
MTAQIASICPHIWSTSLTNLRSIARINFPKKMNPNKHDARTTLLAVMSDS